MSANSIHDTKKKLNSFSENFSLFFMRNLRMRKFNFDVELHNKFRKFPWIRQNFN